MIRTKLCAVCGSEFVQRSSWHRTCSTACAIEWTRKKAEAEAKRESRKELLEARKRLMTRSDWLRKAQAAFNRWVRLRDLASIGPICMACQRSHKGQWHAGHYRSVGSCPELRFEPDNVWLVCAPCNTHLSGNLIQMRINLVKKIGTERVDWLEGPHEPKKYTIDDLIGLEKKYKTMASSISVTILHQCNRDDK